MLGVMIMPTVASLSEDALSARCRRRCARARWPWAPTGCRPRCAWCFPAALSGIAAAIVLGMSRAVGETMIVALAAGSQKNMSLDPREGMQTMTGFIAQTAGGENPVGSTSYNTLFAVGLALFVITLVINIISICVRPTLPAGLLMSIAPRTAREVTAATSPPARARTGTSGRSSSWARCGSRCSSASWS